MDDTMLPVLVGVVIVVLTCLAVWMCFKTSNPDTPQRNYHEGSNQWGYGADNSGGVVPEAHKTNVSIDPKRHYTEEEAADIAIQAKGLTILRSDSGRLWKSSMDGRTHAEQEFLNDKTEKNAKTIWLTNSPCLKCAQRLNRERSRMNIFVGNVYCEQDGDTEKERKREIGIMKQNEFTFSAWEVYCRKKGNNALKKTQDEIENKQQHDRVVPQPSVDRSINNTASNRTIIATHFQGPETQTFTRSSQENLSTQQHDCIVPQPLADRSINNTASNATHFQGLDNEYHRNFRLSTIHNGDTVTVEEVFKWIEQEYFSDEALILERILTIHSARSANRAFNDKRTLLYVADNKQVYFSDKKQHAEINFIRSTMTNCQIIENVNITNSPCHKCASKLIKYFKHCRPKPTIYIGRIWRLRSRRDNQALKAMMRQGFKLKVWNKLHDMMYPGNNTTTNHLKKLKKQNYYRYYTLSRNCVQ